MRLDVGDRREVADTQLDLAQLILRERLARIDLTAARVLVDRAVRLVRCDRAACHGGLADVDGLIARGDRDQDQHPAETEERGLRLDPHRPRRVDLALHVRPVQST